MYTGQMNSHHLPKAVPLEQLLGVGKTSQTHIPKTGVGIRSLGLLEFSSQSKFISNTKTLNLQANNGYTIYDNRTLIHNSTAAIPGY